MTELSPRAKALLDAAAGGDEPSTEDRTRVRAAVFAAVGLPIPAAETAGELGKVGLGSGSQAAVAAKASVWLGWKVLAVALVAGGVGTGVYLSQGEEQPVAAVDRRTGAAPAEVRPSESPAAPDVAPTPVVAPIADQDEPALRREAVVQTTEPKKTESPRTDVPKSEAPTITEPATRAPKTEAAKTDRPSAAETKDTEPARVDPSRSLRAEHALLSRARSALRRGDSGQALKALARHREEYAAGALVQERRVLEVLTWCARGQTGKARQLARRFSADHPNSPLGRRLASSCVASGR